MALFLDKTVNKPNLFIRRIAIYASFSASDCIREITFTRGLNLITGEANPTLQNDLAGHSVGKTTLCRLIRYCLGEKNFANKYDQQAIRDNFPHGWVGCEVEINGNMWAVLLPFMSTHAQKPIAAQDETLSSLFDLEKGDNEYFLYKQSLESLNTSQNYGTWGQVLSWLARDQECTQGSYWDWRSTQSQSEVSLPSTYAKRSSLVRCVLGLIPEKEEQLRQELEQITIEKDSHTESYQEREKLLFGQLHFGLHSLQSEVNFPLTGLDKNALSTLLMQGHLEELHKEIENAENEWKIAHQTLKNQDILLHSCVNNIRRKESLLEVKEDLKFTQNDDPVAKAALEEIDNFIAEDIECIARVLIATCEKVQAIRHKFAQEASGKITAFDSLEEKIKNEDLSKTIKLIKDDLERLKEEFVLLLKNVKQSNKCVSDKNENLNKAYLKHETTKRQWALIQEAWNVLKNNTEDIELDKTKQKLNKAEEKQGQIEFELANLQEVIKQRWVELEKIFNEICYQTVHCSGDITLKQEELVFTIEQEKKSLKQGALKVLTNITADIACLLSSTYENSHHPGLLIHDSPRNAELRSEIYERILYYLLSQIDHYHHESEIPFQYIVSMTGAPPKDLQKFIRVTVSYDKQGLLFKNYLTPHEQGNL